MKIQVQSLHFDADQKLIDFIDKKVNKLNTFYDNIINADVVLSLSNMNAQVKEKVVVLKTHIPGATLVARETSEIFEESVDLAVESIRRQLTKHKTKIKN
ncbi:MAG: ribosome-associated translation inhibitor RaiA [Chitinophagales bacterium]|nr:ribosome-associated translation inhibitor RaiA [Chitinophagales bacterium]